MGRRRRRGMYIRSRDEALFDYLFVTKIATARQINRDIFHISDLDYVVERLRALVRHGYIRRTTVDISGPKYAYYLARGTFQKYISGRIHNSWTQLKSESRNHDAVLVDIRNRFIKCNQVLSYFTENAIESSFDCPPAFPLRSFIEMHVDAAIIFQAKGKTFNIAIEYEDSQKGSERYTKHFTAYYIRNEIHGVIYIAKEPTLLTRLAELERPLSQNRRSKVFFGKLADVLNTNNKLRFFNNAKDILLIE